MRAITGWLIGMLLVALTTGAHAYSAMYVLGDSLSDNGNNQALLVNGLQIPATVAPYQVPNSNEPLVPITPYALSAATYTYSNGRVWVDYLADSLGLSLAPSLAGGTNFAYGGARTGDLGLGDGNGDQPNSLRVQADQLVNLAPLRGDALYVVWGGGNDIRALGAQLGPKLSDLDAAVRLQASADLQAGLGAGIANLGSTIDVLANAGARNFLVPNLPDLGITPYARFLENNGQPGTMALLTGLSVSYNQGIAGLVAPLQGNPLFSVTTLDIFAFNRAVLADAQPGYNATDACTSENAFTGCSNPESFLYWDGVHPTTASHQAIANLASNALQAVPVPGSLPLAVGGFVMLLGVARRRRAA